MASKRISVIAAVLAAGVAATGLATPSLAAAPVKLDSQRLDAAAVDYSYYRGHHRGWRGNRGGAIAAGVGFGILGAAAIAASRPAYSDGYYDEGYTYYAPRRPVYYAPAPVYEEPVYAPRAYYDYRGPDRRYGNRNGTVDPARGGR